MSDARRPARQRASAPRTLLRLGVALLATGAPIPVRAQQTEAELVRRIHELVPRLDSARASADAARRVEDARRTAAAITSIDTFRVGPLRILAPSDQRQVAERFYLDVWESEFAPFVASSPALARTTFTFQWSPELGRIPVGSDVRRVEIQAWRPASAVRSGVVNAIQTTLAGDLPAAVTRWSGSGLRVIPDVAGAVFRELTVSPARSNRACLGGEAEACWTSLALDLDDTPLDDWYTPDERRLRVAALPAPSRLRSSTWNACVKAGSARACNLYLTQWYPYPPITNDAARRAMLWLALRTGGSGAWDRVRANPDATPSEALRAASGLSSEELAARWRSWVLEGAPPTRALFDSRLLMQLLWIVAFAALATRSTRWRLR